jgi:hemerythrin superfamily protein
MSPLDPFTTLKEDHKKVSNLFTRLEDATDQTKGDLFLELRTALDNHATLEESTLYPKLQQVEQTHDLTLDAVEEHAAVKQLLQELSDEDRTTDDWESKLHQLRKNVEDHVEKEEQELFPAALEVLDSEDVQGLGEALKVAKTN